MSALNSIFRLEIRALALILFGLLLLGLVTWLRSGSGGDIHAPNDVPLPMSTCITNSNGSTACIDVISR